MWSSSSSGGLGGIVAGSFLDVLRIADDWVASSTSCCCSLALLVSFPSTFSHTLSSVGRGMSNPDTSPTEIDWRRREGGGGGESILIVPDALSYLA